MAFILAIYSAILVLAVWQENEGNYIDTPVDTEDAR